MEITIYPYKLIQRTEYSKFKLFNIKEDKYIEDDFVLNKILDDYNKQLNSEKNYLKIEDDCVYASTENIKKEGIKYLFIPEGIKTLGNFAFGYETFEYVSLPSSLESIYPSAFADCKKLKCIDIPKNVTLNSNIFGSCVSLEYVNLPNINKINRSLFYGCSSLKSIIIPDTVEIIENYAFGACASLIDVKLPNNLKGIESCAFAECFNLKNINLPISLKSIDEYAFFNCINLKEVIIPDSVEKIGGRAFFKCKELQYVKLPNNIKTLCEETFRECQHLKTIYLPDSIEALLNGIFKDAEAIKNINVPKNLYLTGSNSPFSESGIESLTFNNNLETPQTSLPVLLDTNINKLIIGKNVTMIPSNLFEKDGSQITSIDYLGTKEEFEEFRKNNKQLFIVLSNLNKITFDEPKIEIIIEQSQVEKIDR